MTSNKEDKFALDRDLFGFKPDTEYIGREACVYDSIDSTNAEAKRNSHMPHGTMFVSRTQTAGRGRLGRNWISDDGSIAVSFLLKPCIEPEQVPLITLVMGLAVKNVICGSMIKWPNDIVLNSKKVCGILTEMATENGKVSYVVAGIGINLNTRAFDNTIKDIATSVYLETGVSTSKVEFLERLCCEIENYYNLFCRGGFNACLEEYKSSCVNLGKEVVIKSDEGDFEAVAVDITETGELLVSTKDGTKKILSGEISVRGIFGYV